MSVRYSRAARDAAAKFGLPLCDDEMSPDNTGVLLEILFPGTAIEEQRKFLYRTKPRKASYVVDYWLPERNLVVEYDGPDHYRDILKIKRDDRKNAYFKEQRIDIIRIPFWLQMQKGVADFLFGVQPSPQQEKAIANKIYRVGDISDVFYSGVLDSPNTPANFLERGRARFREELETYPPVVLSSVKLMTKACIRRRGMT